MPIGACSKYIREINKQVTGAGFGGPLWDICKLEKVWDRNKQTTHTHTEKEITKAPLITVPIDH